MIRTKDINIISDMLKYAKKRKHFRKYTMVSFLVKNKTIVSTGINIAKTHTNTPQLNEYLITSHAEICCLSKYLVKRKPITKDMTLYVVGLTQGKGDTSVNSSAPCESCEKFIRSSGVSRVVFVKNDFVNDLEIREMLI